MIAFAPSSNDEFLCVKSSSQMEWLWWCWWWWGRELLGELALADRYTYTSCLLCWVYSPALCDGIYSGLVSLSLRKQIFLLFFTSLKNLKKSYYLLAFLLKISSLTNTLPLRSWNDYCSYKQRSSVWMCLWYETLSNI